MDIRIEKTKKSITNAFLELRSKKPIEKIRVKELCEKAMVNKSTFYTYYADIYALSETLEKEVVELVMANLPNPENWITDPKKFTYDLFLAYLSQDSMIQILFSGSRSNLLIEKIKDSLEDVIYTSHPEYREDFTAKFILTYCIYGGYYSFRELRKEGEHRAIGMEGVISEQIMRYLQEQKNVL